jgi:hypothetical protein
MAIPICSLVCGFPSLAAIAAAISIAARLEKDSSQVIPSGGGPTPVTFEVVVYEVGADANEATDSITVLTVGIYQIIQEVEWAANGVTGGVVTSILLNGAPLPWILRDDMVAAEAVALGKTTTISLAAGDVIGLQAINSSASDRTLTNASLTIVRVAQVPG